MTIIIGKNSNFSQALHSKIENSILISSKTPIVDMKKINFNDQEVTIVFNNFQKSTLLSDLSNPVDYIHRSIVATAQVMNYFITNYININKVIYTSSSSVYGNNIFCNENDVLMPLSLHASLKISNEKLIENICVLNKIDFTICRLFNMYGGNDEFSVVHKIVKAAKNDEKITIFNNGNAIRDFIHIDDVVFVYTKLINKKNINFINVGTSNGTSIKNILDYLHNKQITIKYDTLCRDELKVSTSGIGLLKSFVKINFIDVKEYIYSEILK